MTLSLLMDRRVSPATRKVVDMMYNDITPALRKSRSKVNKTKARGCLHCIAKTLLYMDYHGYGYAAVSLDKTEYDGKVMLNGKVKDILPSYSYMIDILPMLNEVGWVKYEKKDQVDYPEHSQRKSDIEMGLLSLKPDERISTIKRGKKWKDYYKSNRIETNVSPPDIPLPVIEVKHNGKVIECPDTEESRQMISNTRLLNAWYSKNKIVYDEDRLFIWLKRIFTDELEKGGRYYSHKGVVQSLSKEDRQSIAINGMNICELDYVACQYRIISDFNAADLEKDFDPYSLPDYPDVDRNVIKLACSIMLNTGNKRATYGSLRKHIGVFGYKPKEIVDAILDHNWYAEDYVFKDMGMNIQRVDSDICQQVLIRCMREDVPVFPIHDSFLCRECDKDKLYKIMLQSWHNVLGLSLNCRIRVEE